ncbi:MAG TPA: antitoxin family protein [Nostocaceae cyanobacterium]|nr:antitoxin family protein [Nostocaceae cyanobacterium]
MMSQTVKAIYHNGVFIPQTVCNLSEGAEVELLIKSPQIVSPPITDAETKRQLLKSLISRMQQNPIPLNAPKFTRDMLYERR